MPCLFALFAGFFPRLGVLFLWLARPSMFASAFDGSWLLPLLGVVFLPFTTLMYVLLWNPVGLYWYDWMWIGMAFVIDLGGIASSGWANRGRLSTGTTYSMPPAQ
jgi:hypothetical protein